MTPEKEALIASIRASVRLLTHGTRLPQLEDDKTRDDYYDELHDAIDALAAMVDAQQMLASSDPQGQLQAQADAELPAIDAPADVPALVAALQECLDNSARLALYVDVSKHTMHAVIDALAASAHRLEKRHE